MSAGDVAPDFTLPDADGNEVSLHDYRGRKVIVYFYPAASTPGCTKQACDFRDSLAELNGAASRSSESRRTSPPSSPNSAIPRN
ncbi:hypothetical protein GCM10020255_092610 [Rhodococcus baikonurensis]